MKKFFLLLFSVFPFFSILNSQPLISSFSPQSGKVGDTINIVGNGFSTIPADNAVFFGSIKAAVISSTSASLSVAVPGGAVYGPITVTTQNLVGVSPKSFYVELPGCPTLNQETFSLTSALRVGNYPTDVYAGDIDADGRPDLVTTNAFSNTVSVLKNNGTGGNLSFASKLDLSTGVYPQRITVADLDGDTRPEIVVANSSSSTLSVFRNTSSSGSVSFAPKSDFTTGAGPADVAVGDLDGDGKLDLVVVNRYSSSFSFFRNTSTSGAVSFAARVTQTTGNLTPVSIAVSDIDRDGKPDVVIASCGSVKDSISIFKNQTSAGSVVFAARKNLLNEGGAYKLAVEDFDGDGYADVAAANYNLNKIAVFRNTGAGMIAFDPPVDLLTGSGPQAITVGDVNGDGKADILSSNSSANTVSIFTNNGTTGGLSFGLKIDYASSAAPSSVAVADFDLNGNPDVALATANSSVFVFRKALSQRIFLVDSSKTGNAVAIGLCTVNQSDWVNACGNLQTALNAALEGDQIWVSKGTYFPSQDSAGNSVPATADAFTFLVKSGVKIYGGFSAVETELAQRNRSNNETILSGEINANGTSTRVNNVVWFSNVNNATLLNGFTIKSGNALSQFPGGGVYLNASSPVISNCIISANSSASFGGGIYMNASSPQIVNCSIYGNSAQNGGAMAITNSFPSVINCTIVKNTAFSTGGGLYLQGSAPAVSNSIVWGNSAPGSAVENISSTAGTPAISYSIIGQTSGVFAGTGNKNVNPLFVDAGNGNFSLIKGSFAVSGGSVGSYPLTSSSVDLLGNPRTSNGTISIGAYQGGKNPLSNSNGILYVKNEASTIVGNGKSWATAYNNLSDALIVSNNNKNVLQVWIAKGSYTPSNDSTSLPNPSNVANLTFAIKRGISLYGGFVGNESDVNQRLGANGVTVLSGLVNVNSAATNVASVLYISNIDSSATLDGLTITNGVGYVGGTYGGGAISLRGAKLILRGCRIVNNAGSAIYNWQGDLEATTCYFSGNTGGYGGAIQNYFSSMTVGDCDFINNIGTAQYTYGGAVANEHSFVKIRRSNFVNNKVKNSGGALYNSNGSILQVTNCKFIGNQAGEQGSGGAVANWPGCNAVFINCVFSKNFAQSGGAMANVSNCSLINCSVADNSAYYYGGIYNAGSGKISNSIVWGNLSIYNRSGDNLYDGNTNSPLGNFTVNNAIIGYGNTVYPGTGNLNVNPNFVDTAGGVLTLKEGSPAIDAGDNASYPGTLTNDFDVDGAPRQLGPKIDIGASEFFISFCGGGTARMTSNLQGSSYQWQVNSGSGFVNLSDNNNVNGSGTVALQLYNIPSSWNGYLFRCLVNGNFSNVSAIKYFNQWTGALNSAWGNAANWSCGTVPDTYTDVVINSGTLLIDSNVIVRSLVANPGVNIVITPGNKLTVLH